MAIAALGALYLQYLFEAAMVLLLYFIAEYFEDYIQERARRTVEKFEQVSCQTKLEYLLMSGADGGCCQGWCWRFNSG